jgi:hypothetical protein
MVSAGPRLQAVRGPPAGGAISAPRIDDREDFSSHLMKNLRDHGTAMEISGETVTVR